MSDHQDAPDPIDNAYVRAEATLDDDGARAARRARVLAAVAREPMVSLAKSPVRRHGGWLVAAGVAGLGVFVATQIYEPAPRQGPATPARPAAAVPMATAAPALAAPRVRAPQAFPAASPDSAPLDVPPAMPPPPPPMAIPAAPAPAMAPPPPPASEAEGASGDAPSPAPPVAQRAEIRAFASRVASEPAAKLRAAAAAGRIAEMESLLAGGVPVDVTDPDGETALMKSIQADRPAAAALLRRHGASLDLRNHAGESARDMATAKGDASLDRAIGLEP